jgi:tellurium resistance protein TerD
MAQDDEDDQAGESALEQFLKGGESQNPVPKQEEARSDDQFDPIKQQQAKEIAAEQARLEKLRARNVPEHMLDMARDDDEMHMVQKGQTLDLTQKVPALRKIYIGTGWTPKTPDEDVDIDLSIFLLDRHDMTAKDSDVVFYNQPSILDGAIKHDGDNRSGAGDGDEESITVDLNAVPFDVLKIMIVLSCYDEREVGRNFGQVRSLYVRLVDGEYKEEICRFNVPEEHDGNTGIYIGVLMREGPRWMFEVQGQGIGRGGLPAIASKYGIIVKELQSTG